MALFAIPNPEREFEVGAPIEKIALILDKFTIIDKDFKFIDKKKALSMWTYNIKEFMSAGAYYDISISKISEEQTKVKINVRRAFGTFNQSHEVSHANTNIDSIIEYVARYADLSLEDIENLTEEVVESNKTDEEKFAAGAYSVFKYIGYGIVGLLILGFLVSTCS